MIGRCFATLRCKCQCKDQLLSRNRVWNSFSNVGSKRRESTLMSKVREIPPNAYVMLVFPCISFYLGVWQIKRRKWKNALIEELERKHNMPGADIPVDFTELTPARQYESFILIGQFDHSREIFIGPRSRIDHGGMGGDLRSSGETVGVHVVTPFKLSATGEEVLVNRGWVTRSQRKANYIHRPEGEQKLEAVYRVSESGAGDGKYDARLDMWAKRSVSAIAHHLGTREYFFDLSHSAKLSRIPNNPIAGQTNVQLRNEHLSYIFTWFSLTILMLLIWGNRHLRGSSGRGGKNILSVINSKKLPK